MSSQELSSFDFSGALLGSELVPGLRGTAPIKITTQRISEFVMTQLENGDFRGPEGPAGPEGPPGPDASELIPSSVYTETISCFFPGMLFVDDVAVWTAGLDVKFEGGFFGYGNIINNPTNSVVIDIIDKQMTVVGNITVSNMGVFTFTMTAPNSNTDYLIAAGDYLKFQVKSNTEDAKNLSFTLIGTRMN